MPRSQSSRVAAANAAALAGKAYAYVVWNVEDASHDVVGTQFAPPAAKIGNEELESWLLRLLTPKIHFRFFEVDCDGKRAVLLEIERAFRQPVQFQGQELVRVGTYKKKLKDFPEKERRLWRIFDSVPFEHGPAAERASDDDVLKLLYSKVSVAKCQRSKLRKSIYEIRISTRDNDGLKGGVTTPTNKEAALSATELTRVTSALARVLSVDEVNQIGLDTGQSERLHTVTPHGAASPSQGPVKQLGR